MKSKWYILQVYANFEDKVAQNLFESAKKDGLEHLIEEIFIPKENIKQTKNGKVINLEKNLYQGYVYLKIDLTDALYDIIRDIPRVSGFLGANKTGLGRVSPIPVSEKEIQRIKELVSERKDDVQTSISHEIGEKLQVIDGPFQSFFGIVDTVDSERSRLKLSISIFNRDTLVELEYHQVKKVS